MSKQSDFLELLTPLWDIEEFNMWNPQAHSSIAYVLDSLYGKEQYDTTYNRLLELAKNRDYNEFAWEMSQATLVAYKQDVRVEAADLDYMEKAVSAQAKRYPLKQLYAFGLVAEKYVPDWFFGLFHSYLKVEESKRDTTIKN